MCLRVVCVSPCVINLVDECSVRHHSCFDLIWPSLNNTDVEALITFTAFMLLSIYASLCFQGTLQQFVDDFFRSVLCSGTVVPPAIKYFFDFLDEQAFKHENVDEETIHIWKTNRYVCEQRWEVLQCAWAYIWITRSYTRWAILQECDPLFYIPGIKSSLGTLPHKLMSALCLFILADELLWLQKDRQCEWGWWVISSDHWFHVLVLFC